MQVDWSVVATIAAPVIALFVGAALDRFLERKPRLIAYFAHTSAFRVASTAPPVQVHTHSIVIRNTGKRPASDVHVSHYVLPDFNVLPDVPFEVQTLPSGGKDIVFPILVPGQQLSISYLYGPWLLFNQIHSGIRHRDGFATEVTVLPTPQYPAWVLLLLRALVVLGAVAAIYIVAAAVRALSRVV